MKVDRNPTKPTGRGKSKIQGAPPTHKAVKPKPHEKKTESKQAEKDLLASQRIIEGIINAIPMRVFWKDKNLVYLGCNAAYARDKGFTDPKDVIGKDDYQMARLDQAELYRGDDRQVIESGRSKILVEESQVTPDGNLFTLLTSKVPLRSSTGEIIGVIGTYMDITERKRAEEALRESEERYLLLFEHSPDGVLLIDLETGKVIEANETASRQLGYTREEFTALRISDWEVLEKPEETAERIQKIIREGSDDFETLHRTKSGAIRNVRVWVKTLEVNDRAVFYAIFQDITERRRAEEALSASRAQLASIIDAAMDAIIIVDSDQRIAGFNAAAEKMFGYPAAHAIGQPLALLLPERFRGRHREQFAGFGDDGKTTRAIGTIPVLAGIRANGEEFPVEISISRVEVAGKRLFTTIARDVTERKRAENELRTLSTRQEAILAAVPDILMEVNKDKVYTWANLAGVKFFGEDVIGKEAAFYFEGDQDTYGVVKPLFNGSEDVIYVESWQRRKDGEKRLLAWWCRVLKDTDGNATGALSSAHDITERKRAEMERQLLLEIMLGLVATEDLQDFLSLVHHSICKVIYAENFFIALYNKGTALFEVAYSVDKFDLPAPPSRLEKSVSAYVFRTGQPLLLTQAGFDELAAQGEVELVGTNSPSWLGVPLKTSRETIGVMVMQDYDHPNRYSERDINFLVSIAGQVALSVERKRAEEEIRRRANEYTALYETSRDLVTQQDLTTLLRTIVERATHLLGAPRGLCYLYDVATDELELVVEHGSLIPLGARLKKGEGAAGVVMRTREPFIVDNYSVWEGRSTQYKGIEIAAVLEVPMLYHGELIGVLGVSEVGSSTRHFIEADARLLSLFASSAAGAVHNARLFTVEQARSEELASLYDLSRSLADTDDFDNILSLTAHHLVESCHVTFAHALLVQGDELVVCAAFPIRAFPRELQIGHHESVAALSFCQHALEQSDPIIVRATDLDITDAEREFLSLGMAQLLCLVPFHVGENQRGLWILGEARKEEREPFTAEKLRLIGSIREQVTGALQRANLREQTARQLDRLDALHSIDLAISASMDLRMTLNVLLEHVKTQLNADATDVLLLNPHSQTLEYAAGRGFRSRAIERTRLRIGEGQAGRAALERCIIQLPDFAASGAIFAQAELLAAENVASYFAMPLISKGQVKGVLEIFQRSPFKPDSEWLNFLETLAGQAAIAIDSAQLFENLQRSNADLSLAYDATIEGWSHALDLRDKETEGHTLRVTEITMRLAQAMGIGDDELVNVRRGALLHDIGKMGVPDKILLKPGKLTDEEWVAMRNHPTFAFELLSPIAYLRPALDIPYCHHEKWDGTGYPRGLKDEQIPLAARIFAIVDVWDALRSDRPYRPAWDEGKVREHIRSLAGTHFDPEVVPVFLELMEKTLRDE